jgi:hypothetical protein
VALQRQEGKRARGQEEIKNGIRFIRVGPWTTNNFVSESLKFITIENLNNKSILSSITECTNALLPLQGYKQGLEIERS